MTAIQGFIQPNRRPGELGIHSVDHFHFVVPDLAVAQNFYGEFGLDIGSRNNLLTINTHEHPHQWGTIGEGPRKKHGYVSFAAFEDDIERFSERLQTMGIKRLDPPPGIEFERLMVPRSRRQLGRDQSCRKVFARRKDPFLVQVRSRGSARRAVPQPDATHPPAASRSYPDVHA